MYKGVYKYFNDRNLIYPLQFDFMQRYSKFHALFILAEIILKNLVEDNVDCDVFVELHKAFDPFENDILLLKLGRYDLCVVWQINSLSLIFQTGNNTFKPMFIISILLS